MTIIRNTHTQNIFAGFTPNGKTRWVMYEDGMVAVIFITKEQANEVARDLRNHGFVVEVIS
jgi:hypothetical protein